MNLQLLVEFSVDDVQIALSQMAHLKLLGLDGFTIGFYQQQWVTVGPGGLSCHFTISKFFPNG